MKIGLSGYGKMGRAIEEIAIDRGHEILFKSNSVFPLNQRDIDSVDVVIEFTKPDLAVQHIEMVLGANKPIIVGTTGWNDQLTKVENLVSTNGGSLLYASNFSIGVNLFFELNEKLAAPPEPTVELPIKTNVFAIVMPPIFRIELLLNHPKNHLLEIK
jgi:4-hydroxy-tetrahydrodipicolinate reductase